MFCLAATAPHACSPPTLQLLPGALGRAAAALRRRPLCCRSAIISEAARRLSVAADLYRLQARTWLWAALDVAAGCLAERVLRAHADSLALFLHAAVALVFLRLPERGATWLMAARPLGIKLHEPLCASLGAFLLNLAHHFSAAGLLLVPGLQPGVVLLSRAGVLGITAQFSLAADALALLTLPLLALQALSRAWLRLHWAGISNLWRKLYRPPPSQHVAYRVERLTVGALLLTPLLLLAPTLLAYTALVEFMASLGSGAHKLISAALAQCTAPKGAKRSLPWFEPLPSKHGVLLRLRT